MPADPNSVEQAVSRTLRDNLEKIQRNANELHQAINDLVSACSSSRASNALPSMLRAQTSAAALSATLEVLSRFVTGSLQTAMRMPFEPEAFQIPTMSAPAPPPPPSKSEQPPPLPAHPKEEISWTRPAPVPPAPAPAAPVFREPPPPIQPPPIAEIAPPPEMSAIFESAPALEPVTLNDPEPLSLPEPASAFDLELPPEAQPAVEAAAPLEAAPVFNLDLLPLEEQELHRRAFRVAKVSMQDIRMLRPEEVRVGREKKDLCIRLRDDIEKAHKEYDRRFQAIQGHPVDYFYDWMVEILGGGDPKALGEYPYPSPVLRR